MTREEQARALEAIVPHINAALDEMRKHGVTYASVSERGGLINLLTAVSPDAFEGESCISVDGTKRWTETELGAVSISSNHVDVEDS